MSQDHAWIICDNIWPYFRHISFYMSVHFQYLKCLLKRVRHTGKQISTVISSKWAKKNTRQLFRSHFIMLDRTWPSWSGVLGFNRGVADALEAKKAVHINILEGFPCSHNPGVWDRKRKKQRESERWKSLLVSRLSDNRSQTDRKRGTHWLTDC